MAGLINAQVFDAAKIGPPLSNAPAGLYLQPGTAPAGAVVVLHGRNGVALHDREWARRLAGWGYAALLIDSFGPRGFREVGNRGRLVPPEAQARDAFDGTAYLRAAPEVSAARVGVIGFSHGGWAVLKAVLAGVVRQASEPAFAAAVAYYPGCDPLTSALETDTLILMGDADDWTSPLGEAEWRSRPLISSRNGRAWPRSRRRSCAGSPPADGRAPFGCIPESPARCRPDAGSRKPT